MSVLSSRGAFWVTAAVAGLALWASAAPSVVYPLYSAQWGLSTTTTTAIFAVYPIILIPVLLVFGNLSDYVGRRESILIGIGLIGAGAVVFGLAPDVVWVFVGRALLGIGVGFSLSPATAAMVEFGGDGPAHRASSTTTAATAAGLALATIIGGALVQYAPFALHLAYWVLFLVAVLVFLLVWRMPRHGRFEASGGWRPRPLTVRRGTRLVFTAGALAMSASFALGAVVIGLGAHIVKDLVRTDDAFVGGLALAVSAIVIGVVAVLARSLPTMRLLAVAPVLMAVGLTAFILAGLDHSLVLFLVASVFTGTGYAFSFSGGLGIISKNAAPEHRAAGISAAYAVAYFAQGAVAVGLGAVATAAGLQLAVTISLPLIVGLGVAAVLLAAAAGRRKASTPAKASTTANASTKASTTMKEGTA